MPGTELAATANKYLLRRYLLFLQEDKNTTYINVVQQRLTQFLIRVTEFNTPLVAVVRNGRMSP